MEIYLGNPGEKLTAWCKANYGKPLPKDPSEGGVWTVTCDYGGSSIKCSEYRKTDNGYYIWEGTISDTTFASVTYYIGTPDWNVQYVLDSSTGDE